MLIFLGTILELVQFPFSVIDTKMPPHHHRHHYYSNHSSSWTQIQNGQFRIRYFWIVNLLNLLNLLLPSCLRAGTADEKNSNPQNHQSFRRAQCFGEQQSRLFLELAWVQHDSGIWSSVFDWTSLPRNILEFPGNHISSRPQKISCFRCIYLLVACIY